MANHEKRYPTPKEMELLSCVDMGAATRGDLAKMMKVSPPYTDKVRRGIEATWPEEEVEFFYGRTEAVVELFEEGATGKEVAGLLGYKLSYSQNQNLLRIVGKTRAEQIIESGKQKRLR